MRVSGQRPFWLSDWVRLLAWPALLLAIVALAFSIGRATGFEDGVRAGCPHVPTEDIAMKHSGFTGPFSAEQEIELWQERLAHYRKRVRDLTLAVGALPSPSEKKEILKAATLAKNAESNLRRARLSQALFASHKRSH